MKKTANDESTEKHTSIQKETKARVTDVQHAIHKLSTHGLITHRLSTHKISTHVLSKRHGERPDKKSTKNTHENVTIPNATEVMVIVIATEVMAIDWHDIQG